MNPVPIGYEPKSFLISKQIRVISLEWVYIFWDRCGRMLFTRILQAAILRATTFHFYKICVTAIFLGWIQIRLNIRETK